eukprot:1162100-Pelagomonas_calceolata.AAC.11
MGQQRHRLRRQQLPWSQTSQVFGPWKASLTNLDRPAEKKENAKASTHSVLSGNGDGPMAAHAVTHDVAEAIQCARSLSGVVWGDDDGKHSLGGVLQGDGDGPMAAHAVAHDTGSRQVQLVRELGGKQLW